jgi:hypothetical protein
VCLPAASQSIPLCWHLQPCLQHSQHSSRVHLGWLGDATYLLAALAVTVHTGSSCSWRWGMLMPGALPPAAPRHDRACCAVNAVWGCDAAGLLSPVQVVALLPLPSSVVATIPRHHCMQPLHAWPIPSPDLWIGPQPQSSFSRLSSRSSGIALQCSSVHPGCMDTCTASHWAYIRLCRTCATCHLQPHVHCHRLLLLMGMVRVSRDTYHSLFTQEEP